MGGTLAAEEARRARKLSRSITAAFVIVASRAVTR
jgi:hypothetical protein